MFKGECPLPKEFSCLKGYLDSLVKAENHMGTEEGRLKAVHSYKGNLVVSLRIDGREAVSNDGGFCITNPSKIAAIYKRKRRGRTETRWKAIYPSK
jgi:hypothetical protein